MSLKEKASEKFKTVFASDEFCNASSPTNHEVVWDGANCVLIHSKDGKIEIPKAKEIMDQLPVFYTFHELL